MHWSHPYLPVKVSNETILLTENKSSVNWFEFSNKNSFTFMPKLFIQQQTGREAASSTTTLVPVDRYFIYFFHLSRTNHALSPKFIIKEAKKLQILKSLCSLVKLLSDQFLLSFYPAHRFPPAMAKTILGQSPNEMAKKENASLSLSHSR